MFKAKYKFDERYDLWRCYGQSVLWSWIYAHIFVFTNNLYDDLRCVKENQAPLV